MWPQHRPSLPMPAATGIRFLRSRSAPAAVPAASAQAASALETRFCPVPPRTSTWSADPHRARSARACRPATPTPAPSPARGARPGASAEEQAHVDLARRAHWQLQRPNIAASSRNSSGASVPPARPVDDRALRGLRGRDRGSPAGRRGPAPASRRAPSPMGERLMDQGLSSPSAARAGSDRRAPNRRSARAEHGPGDRAQDLDVRRELSEHRRHPVRAGRGLAASRSPTSRWTITTQLWTLGSWSIVRRIMVAAIP